MLDSKTLRKETKKVSLSLKKRGSDFDLDSYLKMDQKMRDLISTVEELGRQKITSIRVLPVLKFQKMTSLT